MNATVASLLLILEGWVPWNDTIVVSAGQRRKQSDFLSELCSSLCERRLERTVLRPALLPVKTTQFTQFFLQVWRHTVKSLSLTDSVLRLFRQKSGRDPEPVQKRWRKEKSLLPAGNLTPSPSRSVRCLFTTLTELPPSLTIHLIINSGIVLSERTEHCHVNKGPHRIICHIVYTLQTATHWRHREAL